MDWLWYGQSLPARLLAAALSPLEALYRVVLTGRLPPSAASPVISVGNLTVGGNGKTTLVIDLARRLQRRGLRVAVVSRGYRRRGRKPLCFEAGSVPATRRAGDEPVLLARRLSGVTVLVDADRQRAARQALQTLGAQVVLADDAFQHRHLARSLDIVAINVRRGFGNGRLLPAGPLREPPSALERAQLVVFTYAEPGQQASELRRRFRLPEGLPAEVCDIRPAGFVTGSDLQPASAPSGPVVAFCAVADGEGFFGACRRAGLDLAARLSFSDHHEFGQRDLQRLDRLCRRLKATAVCTEKDLVRLPQPPPFPVLALRSEVVWEKTDRLERLLDEFVGVWSGSGSLP